MKVLGYVHSTLYAKATDRTFVSFDFKAYVVRGMHIPLLLGEDFQTTYEIGLDRHADGHSEVCIRNHNPRIIAASSAVEEPLGFEI